MTNAQIIAMETMLRGITEPIHTYAAWKQRGYLVRKGEKSSVKFPIWKHTNSYTDKDGIEHEGHMIMKMSAFFTASQVDKIEETEAA